MHNKTYIYLIVSFFSRNVLKKTFKKAIVSHFFPITNPFCFLEKKRLIKSEYYFFIVSSIDKHLSSVPSIDKRMMRNLSLEYIMWSDFPHTRRPKHPVSSSLLSAWISSSWKSSGLLEDAQWGAAAPTLMVHGSYNKARFADYPIDQPYFAWRNIFAEFLSSNFKINLLRRKKNGARHIHTK